MKADSAPPSRADEGWRATEPKAALSTSRGEIPDARFQLPFVLLVFLTHAFVLMRAQGFRVIDDAYITFRYIDNLLNGHGLVFNIGERVEGYSNFLWLVLLIPFRAFGIDPVHAAQGLGMTCGLGVLIVTYHLALRLMGSPRLGFFAVLLLALDGSFVRWAVDGLETQLFTLLLLTAFWLEMVPGSRLRPTGRSFLEGLSLGLASLTRPEGLLFIVGIVAYRVVGGTYWALRQSPPGPVGRTPEQRLPLAGSSSFWLGLLALLSGAALITGPHFLWRHAYYGEWLPNTAYVKVIPGFVSFVRGMRYAVLFGYQHLAIWAALLVAHVLGRRARAAHARHAAHPLRLPALASGAMVLYIIVIGGDWMNQGRFFVPIAPFLALLVVERAARALGEVIPGQGYRCTGVTWLLLAFAAVGGFYGSSWRTEWPRLEQARLEHEGRQAVIAWLKAHAPADALLLTEEIGEIPFYTGLRTLDVYGLIDPWIARHGIYEPDAPAGHQKADLNHSLSFKPEFMVMAGFKKTWQRHMRAKGKGVRYPELIHYDWVPVVFPEGRLEIYRRRDISISDEDGG